MYDCVKGVGVTREYDLYCHHLQCCLTLFLMEEVQEFFLDFHHNGVFGLVVKDVNTSEQVVYVYKSSAKNFTSEVQTHTWLH